MPPLAPEASYGPRAARAAQIIDPMVFVGALLVVPSLIIDFATTSDSWALLGGFLNWISWGTFATEIVVMLSVVNNRKRWARENALIIVITMITFPLLSGILEVLRLFRLARIFSALRLLRLMRAGQVINRITSPTGLLWTGFFVVVAIVVGAVTFDLAEESTRIHPGLGDSMWWAVTTATTVGYGDLYPTTSAGRIAAVLLMFVGIGFVAMLTASIASWAARVRVQSLHEGLVSDVDAVVQDDFARIEMRLDVIEQRINEIHAALVPGESKGAPS